MTKAILNARVPYPAELVWDVVTSLTDYGWRGDITECRVSGETGFVEVDRGGAETRFTVTDKTPCRRYAFAMRGAMMRGAFEGLFAPDGEGTALTFTEVVEVTGSLRRLLAPAYLKARQRRYLRDLERYLRALSRHVVLVDGEAGAEEGLGRLLRRAVAVALEAEGVAVPCEISVLLTDDRGIREANRRTRQVDRATDVLSFPMFDLHPGEGPGKENLDPATGLAPLGDMCISLPRLRAQAKEYGHSLEREAAYLSVHSVLHLLGYDHADGEDTRRMRRREEAIMSRLGLAR